MIVEYSHPYLRYYISRLQHCHPSTVWHSTDHYSLAQTTMHSTDHGSQSELECIVPKRGYDDLRHAMDKSDNLIYLIFDKSRTFLRARPDIFDSRSGAFR